MFYKKFFSFQVRNSLYIYHNTLLSWNKQIGLISKLDYNNIWIRHFIDSAQLSLYITDNLHNIIDIGTGAGFPGIILAILGYNNIILVEKSYKKSLFIRFVCRKLSISIKIFSGNMNDLILNNYDILLSRAFLKANNIINLYNYYSFKFIFIILKGKDFNNELIYCNHSSLFLNLFKSITNSRSRIIKIFNIRYLK